MNANPLSMRIINVPKPDSPRTLIVDVGPVPHPGDDEALIKVTAAGVNRADLMQCQGQYPAPPGVTYRLGLEISGTIVRLGSKVTGLRAGDPVCALLQGGGYAEYCVVPHGQILPVPPTVSLFDSAALPEAYFTVWSNVFQQIALQPGERILVHGGSSGIGTAAIQLAAALGNEVFTTAGSEEKCRFCESLGASRAINYKTQSFVAEIMRLTGRAGVDAVLDIIGAEYLQKNMEVLAQNGRLAIIATQGGYRGQINLLALIGRRLAVTGSALRPQSLACKKKIGRELLAKVWPLFGSGKLRPVIDSVFPLAEASHAHERMESSKHMGKILLRIAD